MTHSTLISDRAGWIEKQECSEKLQHLPIKGVFSTVKFIFAFFKSFLYTAYSLLKKKVKQLKLIDSLYSTFDIKLL